MHFPKGPVGHFTYEGRGSYLMNKTRGVARHLSMLAGGTGITPCYAVLCAVLKDPGNTTTMSLIFANMTEGDILLRTEIDDLASRHPERFRVHYVLSSPPEGWTQGVGRMTCEMMRERLFPAGEDTLGLMCGPPGLLDNVCVPGLEAMGYAKERMVLF